MPDPPLIEAAKNYDEDEALAETKRILSGIDKGDMAEAVNARGEVRSAHIRQRHTHRTPL